MYVINCWLDKYCGLYCILTEIIVISNEKYKFRDRSTELGLGQLPFLTAEYRVLLTAHV